MSAHIKDIGNNLSILDRYERDITNIKDDLTMYTYIWPFLMGSIIDNKNISSKYSHIWPISKRYNIYRTHIEQSSYTYLPMSSQLQTYLRYTCDILPIYHRFHLYVRYVTNICPYLVIIRDPADSYVRCLMCICQYLATFKDILQNMKYMSPLSAQYQRDLTNIKEVSFISAYIWLLSHRVDIYVLQISNISAYIWPM